MRIIVIYTIFITSCCIANAQPAQPARKDDYFIDEARRRIDMIDGLEDQKVKLTDSARTAMASKVYLVLTDSLQQQMNRGGFNENDLRKFRGFLYYLMLGVSPNNANQIEGFQRKILHASAALKTIHNGTLSVFLHSYPDLSFEIFSMLKHLPEYGDFLASYAVSSPNKIFDKYYQFADESYADTVITTAALVAPVLAKKFILPGNAINLALQRSDKPEIKMLFTITREYGKKSNAYLFIGEIVSGKWSLKQADSIGSKPESLFRALLESRKSNQLAASYSTEFELEIAALKLVRVVNDLHNETEESVRFKGVSALSAEQLYALMVYSEEEIFTSSFNGIFSRFMTKLGKQNGYRFLEKMNFLHFRTLVKMSAAYSSLNKFLASMNKSQADSLLQRFAKDLEQDQNDLSQAVQVADTYASLQDSLSLRILRQTISDEYNRCNKSGITRGRNIYGLLLNLFADKKTFNENWFRNISGQYKLPPLDRIDCHDFFTQADTSFWQIYFYDDEDGEASFATFTKEFTDKDWIIEDSTHYVLIYSRSGLPVFIYANKPKSEYVGQEQLEKLFDDRRLSPDVLVHRGHSYYAFKTIEKIDPDTEVFILGSCGGYNNLSKIFDRASEVNIVSSKQIGTMFVNNPLLRIMADRLKGGKDMVWQEVWEQLGTKIKGNPKAWQRFLDYIPPHKNLGAIFIRAYQKLQDESQG